MHTSHLKSWRFPLRDNFLPPSTYFTLDCVSGLCEAVSCEILFNIKYLKSKNLCVLLFRDNHYTNDKTKFNWRKQVAILVFNREKKKNDSTSNMIKKSANYDSVTKEQKSKFIYKSQRNTRVLLAWSEAQGTHIISGCPSLPSRNNFKLSNSYLNAHKWMIWQTLNRSLI